jgi:hypothetical protein
VRITSSRRRAENEQGSVVLIALLLSGMIVALGLSLVGMASTERAVAANQQAAPSPIRRSPRNAANDWAPVGPGRVFFPAGLEFCAGSLPNQ